MLFSYTCWTLLKSVASSTFFRTPCSGCSRLLQLGSFNPTVTKTTARASKWVTLFEHHRDNVIRRYPTFYGERKQKMKCYSFSFYCWTLIMFLFLTNWPCWANRHIVWQNANHFVGDALVAVAIVVNWSTIWFLFSFFYIFSLTSPAVRMSLLVFIWYWRFFWSRSAQDPLTSLFCCCGFTYI